MTIKNKCKIFFPFLSCCMPVFPPSFKVDWASQHTSKVLERMLGFLAPNRDFREATALRHPVDMRKHPSLMHRYPPLINKFAEWHEDAMNFLQASRDLHKAGEGLMSEGREGRPCGPFRILREARYDKVLWRFFHSEIHFMLFCSISDYYHIEKLLTTEGGEDRLLSLHPYGVSVLWTDETRFWMSMTNLSQYFGEKADGVANHLGWIRLLTEEVLGREFLALEAISTISEELDREFLALEAISTISEEYLERFLGIISFYTEVMSFFLYEYNSLDQSQWYKKPGRYMTKNILCLGSFMKSSVDETSLAEFDFSRLGLKGRARVIEYDKVNREVIEVSRANREDFNETQIG